MIYFGRRYYSPEAGRWLTTDPKGFTDSMNLYAFALNDPYALVDPYGLENFASFTMPISYIPPSVILSAHSLLTNVDKTRLHGIMQAMSGGVEFGIAGCATLGTVGSGAIITVPIMAHGGDQFITGMKTAFTGVHHLTATEQLLQKTGLSSQAASFGNDLIGIAGTLGCIGIIRAAQLTAFPRFNLKENTILTEEGGLLSIEKECATNNQITHLEKQVSSWLGEGTRLIKNEAGDAILLSKDGTRCMRFDFNRTTPHNNPHAHIEIKVGDKWIKSGQIYPIDVPHN